MAKNTLPVTMGQRLRHIIGDSFGANVVEYNLEKALREVKEKIQGPQSLFYDPLSLFMGREWLQRRNVALSHADLRNMARTPIIAAIIATRITQIATYCQPQISAYDYGYKIVSDDPEASKELDKVRAIRTWLYTAGIDGYGEHHFEDWAKKFAKDSLVLDQATSEVVMRRNGTPGYLVVVDGATIRRLKSSINYMLPSGNEPRYVQVINDVIVTQYSEDQLIFMTRNPQSELSFLGYGMSELEVLMRVVTTLLNTDRFNAGLLSQGGTNKGILVVKGDGIEKLQMDAFKRDFREAVRNAASFWRPPVLQVTKDADINWVMLDRSNRDMEYGQLFDFLVKQACAVYQMDPIEINWQLGPSSARMNFEAGIGPKIRASQSKGLKPILTTLANNLNVKVVKKLDPRFRLEFAGLLEERAEDSQIRQREVQSYKTINEVRVELGLPPVKGGDMILNQFYLQNLQNPMGLPPVDATDDERNQGSADEDSLITIEEQLGANPT